MTTQNNVLTTSDTIPAAIAELPSTPAPINPNANNGTGRSPATTPARNPSGRSGRLRFSVIAVGVVAAGAAALTVASVSEGRANLDLPTNTWTATIPNPGPNADLPTNTWTATIPNPGPNTDLPTNTWTATAPNPGPNTDLPTNTWTDR